MWSATLRSVLTTNLVSEAIVGFSDQTLDTNFRVKDIDTFSGDAVGSDQGGFNLGISAAGITNATRASSYSRRTHPYKQASATLTWNKNTHTVSFGGSFAQISVTNLSKALVPAIVFGGAALAQEWETLAAKPLVLSTEPKPENVTSVVKAAAKAMLQHVHPA